MKIILKVDTKRKASPICNISVMVHETVYISSESSRNGTLLFGILLFFVLLRFLFIYSTVSYCP